MNFYEENDLHAMCSRTTKAVSETMVWTIIGLMLVLSIFPHRSESFRVGLLRNRCSYYLIPALSVTVLIAFVILIVSYFAITVRNSPCLWLAIGLVILIAFISLVFHLKLFFSNDFITSSIPAQNLQKEPPVERGNEKIPKETTIEIKDETNELVILQAERTFAIRMIVFMLYFITASTVYLCLDFHRAWLYCI